MQDIETIWVLGLGGVGGFFGGMIAHYINQNKDRRQVYFIARGEHLKEIQKHGLILQSNNDSRVCYPTRVSDDPIDFPAPDLCLVAVKSYDLENAVKQINPLIKNNTVILPLLNGLDIYQRVRHCLDKGIVLPACIYITSYIDKPGKVVHNGPPGRVIFGNDPQFSDFKLSVLLNLCQEMNLNISWVADPQPAIWEKYLMVAPFALVTAAKGKSFGQALENVQDKRTIAAIMEEIIQIGQRKGIALDLSLIDQTLTAAGRFPYDARSSYQRDLENGREKAEGDVFGATIMRMGIETGVSTPATREMIKCINKKFCLA